MTTRCTAVLSVQALCIVVLLGTAPASAHRERDTSFPLPPGEVPVYRADVREPFLVLGARTTPTNASVPSGAVCEG
jgi:hypothetical protein